MKKAVILAAGEGERLRPFTVNKPKVMLLAADQPILQYTIEALAKSGIRDIVIVVGYRKERIFDWLGAGEKFNVDITYVVQEQQLGTAHALAQAGKMMNEDFIVLPGDNLIDAETIREFINVKPPAIMVAHVSNPERYGVVSIEDKILKGIDEKPRQPISSLVNTGIYAFNEGIFELLPGLLDIPDVLNFMLAGEWQIKIIETHGTWLDIVYPWDILSLNHKVIGQLPAKLEGTIERGVSIKDKVSVGEHTKIRSNSYIQGPVVIGNDCDIGPNVCIMPATSIGDNVVIGPFTEIENSVIYSDVNIGAGSVIESSVIDSGCSFRANFISCSGRVEMKVNGAQYNTELGAIIGEGCSLGNNVTAQPGTIVGNYSQIQSLKLINGRLPDRSLVL